MEDNEIEEKNISRKEALTKLSNDILNGTHGIVLFNGAFSLIFSSFYLSYMSEDIKNFFFKDNINIVLFPILMNKFYYFTLNYYSVYTAEKYQKFDLISNSLLISFYIALFNLILTGIKFIIPDDSNSDDYDYYKILYIIQIISSSIPALFIAIFLIVGLCQTSGLAGYLDECNCKDCVKNFSLHKFLFWLLSFIFCCGGCWIRPINFFQEYEYECCGVEECCDIEGNYCNAYCEDNVIFCECCFCDEESKCKSECCVRNCYYCDLCEHSRED